MTNLKGLGLLGLLLGMLLVGCDPSQTSDSESAATADSPTTDLYGAVITPLRQIEDFTLDSTLGNPLTLSERRGQVLLIYFGYMTCPDVCPGTSAELVRVYRELGDLSQQVQVIFVTVDPERDTLERMTLYLQAFDPHFIGLRSDDPVLLKQVMDQFGARATRQEVDSALGYLMDHTASIFLVDQAGRLREQFLFGTPYKDIVHDVQQVLEER